MRSFTALLLLISAVSFGLGISLPIVRFEKLFFFEDTPSLMTLFWGLWNEQNFLVAIAVALFSILFPLIKLTITFMAAFSPNSKIGQSRSATWASTLSKWSMMDVLLVALVIFAAKSSGLASAFAQAGLWFYGLSAISGAVAAALLKKKS